MGTDPDFLYFFIADPDYGTGTYSVFINILIIFSLLIFYLFFAGFLQEKSRFFYRKRALKPIFFMFSQGMS
jgi:hypothetical protein